jgi:hypothetical protein
MCVYAQVTHLVDSVLVVEAKVLCTAAILVVSIKKHIM